MGGLSGNAWTGIGMGVGKGVSNYAEDMRKKQAAKLAAELQRQNTEAYLQGSQANNLELADKRYEQELGMMGEQDKMKRGYEDWYYGEGGPGTRKASIPYEAQTSAYDERPDYYVSPREELQAKERLARLRKGRGGPPALKINDIDKATLAQINTKKDDYRAKISLLQERYPTPENQAQKKELLREIEYLDKVANKILSGYGGEQLSLGVQQEAQQKDEINQALNFAQQAQQMNQLPDTPEVREALKNGATEEEIREALRNR